MEKESFKHYGVLGMRWGVRRNRDNVFSRTSSRTTRGLENRLKRDEKRVSKGKTTKYDTAKVKAALDKSKAFDKRVNDRVSQMSIGKAAVQTLLMGSRGALRYNQLREMGKSRIVSYGASLVSNSLRVSGMEPVVGAIRGMQTNKKYKAK